MQFLKALFWLILGCVIAVFLIANSGGPPVEIVIWGGLILEVRLWLLLIVMFLLGFLPPFVIYQARMWSLRRRLETQTHVANAPMPGRNAPAPPEVVPRSNL
jgi:membrane protein implicated in regulation of membrane protease activity